MTCHVFISYRRKDSGAWAGRVFDRLAQVFPAKSVFFDVDGIEPGIDFTRALTERLSTCKVLLVIIGPSWLSSTDERGTRLIDLPNDYVAAEIQAALERNVRVIPVLVDGARMPSESDLPSRLRPLVWRQAVELSHARFTADSEVLVESVTRAALTEFPEGGSSTFQKPANSATPRTSSLGTGAASTGTSSDGTNTSWTRRPARIGLIIFGLTSAIIMVSSIGIDATTVAVRVAAGLETSNCSWWSFLGSGGSWAAASAIFASLSLIGLYAIEIRWRRLSVAIPAMTVSGGLLLLAFVSFNQSSSIDPFTMGTFHRCLLASR